MSRRSLACFAAFTAVFAVLVASVFWGTWSPDFVPVMPDARTNFPASGYVREFVAAWLAQGLFVPDDLKVFLGSPWWWVELQYALALYAAALGMAYFCRGRGLRRVACYGAGLLLAFSGYWCTLFSAGHLGWFRWMTYGVFAFGLVDRAIGRRSWRHFALFGAVLAWASFYQSDLWLLFALLTCAYGAWAAVRERTLPWRGALLAAAVFLLVGAPAIRKAFTDDLAKRDEQVAAAAEGEDAAQAAERRWVFATNWSLPPAETAEAVWARLNGDTSCPLTISLARAAGKDTRPYTGALGRPLGAAEGNYRQHSLYLGLVTVLLALVALLRALCGRGRGRGDVVFFAVAALVAVALAFGRDFAPLYRLVFALPFGDYLRAPVKWLHLAEFALAVLAAYALDALACRRWRYAALAAAALALVGAVDLVRVDSRYLARVDMSKARAHDADMQLTFLARRDFDRPEVRAMRARGLIVPLAYHFQSSEVYLVGVLSPRDRHAPPKPLPPLTPASALGVLSLAVGALTAGFFCVGRRRRDGC